MSLPHTPDANSASPLSTHQQLVASISHQGYAVVPDFLPPEQIQLLAAEALQLQIDGEMKRAGTGQDGSKPDDKVRGDFIHWLEADTISVSQQYYLQQMETLRSELNSQLYLGLFDLESHFAIYPPGAVYRRHLDQFQGNEQRQVSCILYLNQQWQHDFGGQLRIYLNGAADEPYIDVEPTGGTLVAFLSGKFLHEVLPAQRQRISLTGWHRTRP